MRNIGTFGFIFLLLSGFFVGSIALWAPGESSEFESTATITDPKPQLPEKKENSVTLCALSHEIQNLWNLRKNSVVKVMGAKKGNDNQDHLLFGTGFFTDCEGNILTTATIVTEAENLWVEYQGLSYAVTVEGKDLITNLAIIKLLKKPESFTPILLPKTPSHRMAAQSSLVVSIGCALGMEPAPTLGLITGKNILFGDRVFVTTYLRSDINICGGESGAPVFNGDGSLCGVLIAALPELRSSFIIPETALGRIFNDIVNNKSVKYCSAGFSVRGQISETGQKEVVISSIDEQKIKYEGTETLRIGDIVTKIGGQEIASEGDIADILFLKHPNESLSMSVTRNKKVLGIVITLSEKNF